MVYNSVNKEPETEKRGSRPPPGKRGIKMNNAINNRNYRQSAARNTYSSYGRVQPTETAYDRLVIKVCKLIRFFKQPIMRLLIAAFTIVFAAACFIGYAVGMLTGTIGFVGAVLLFPVMVGIFGLVAKACS